jgi:hypothetical protein
MHSSHKNSLLRNISLTCKTQEGRIEAILSEDLPWKLLPGFNQHKLGIKITKSQKSLKLVTQYHHVFETSSTFPPILILKYNLHQKKKKMALIVDYENVINVSNISNYLTFH